MPVGNNWTNYKNLLEEAMYIGKGVVVHVVQGESGNESVETFGKKGFEMLSDVVGDCECRINNLDKIAGNTGLRKQEDLKIFENFNEPELFSGSKVDVPYSLLEKNCEYYVKVWRYGKRFTVQGEMGIKVGIAFLKLLSDEDIEAESTPDNFWELRFSEEDRDHWVEWIESRTTNAKRIPMLTMVTSDLT
ncbi:Retinoic acid receptor responder protein 3 [Folsomia candida]|uniref:Retinoic acid receptor responder protein 3 n=1 Tax=Folsomia candida TaxID=158441 RepID=A0A226DRS1_FOLCA|nr:Retinoic acid receptor responder protein 3 [Folsomia candida]